MRGDLTKWCQEIQSGVYVGNVSARIRERLWQRITHSKGLGEATIVYNTNNELGYTFRTTRKDKQVVDADGIPLMKSLFENKNNLKHGFSNAYKFHQAKKFSHAKQQRSEFAVLDIETTGLTPNNNQIISIGAVKNSNGSTDAFYRLVKLEGKKSIPLNISRMTGLTDQRLAEEGAALKDVIIDLQHFLGNLPVIGYNVSFDESFLEAAVIKHNLIQFNNRMVDMLPRIKKLDKFCDNYQLSTILERYKINNEHPHNALYDAKATMELATKLMKKGILRI